MTSKQPSLPAHFERADYPEHRSERNLSGILLSDVPGDGQLEPLALVGLHHEQNPKHEPQDPSNGLQCPEQGSSPTTALRIPNTIQTTVRAPKVTMDCMA